MGQTDLEALLDMGFEPERAELAVKRTGGCESKTSFSNAHFKLGD